MLKQNMPGLLEKCIQFFKNTYQNFFDFNYKLESQAEPEIDLFLDPLKLFFEDYIGVVITDFESFDENIPKIGSYIVAKLITNVNIHDNELTLILNKIDGTYGGKVVISPTLNGKFVEADNDDMEPNTKYRFKFFGGDFVEYVDPVPAKISFLR